MVRSTTQVYRSCVLFILVFLSMLSEEYITHLSDILPFYTKPFNSLTWYNCTLRYYVFLIHAARVIQMINFDHYEGLGVFANEGLKVTFDRNTVTYNQMTKDDQGNLVYDAKKKQNNASSTQQSTINNTPSGYKVAPAPQVCIVYNFFSIQVLCQFLLLLLCYAEGYIFINAVAIMFTIARCRQQYNIYQCNKYQCNMHQCNKYQYNMHQCSKYPSKYSCRPPMYTHSRHHKYQCSRCIHSSHNSRWFFSNRSSRWFFSNRSSSSRCSFNKSIHPTCSNLNKCNNNPYRFFSNKCIIHNSPCNNTVSLSKVCNISPFHSSSSNSNSSACNLEWCQLFRLLPPVVVSYGLLALPILFKLCQVRCHQSNTANTTYFCLLVVFICVLVF